MALILQQFQNQSPTDPADAGEVASQMMSFANYSQQVAMNDTLTQLSSNLTSSMSELSTNVASLYSSVNKISSQIGITA